MSPRIVVAGAVTSVDNRLLLAQRRYPATVAGLWELPGGKAEDDEDVKFALRRELREELDVGVEVGERLAETVALSDDLTLIALWARITDGVPRPVEHSRLRWVTAEELDKMVAGHQLVPADTVWVPELSGVLRRAR
ncbi:(deoxy)nucleoside triphosphate pyrophosphohydrolase [Gordonia otitidis]|uniref:8-oxo-dGTP diphosphatase n=1 Tax=Gordonia otitidis (strain DSM 44809 / CCUG 52243 / JCM 12355 / NBRC 100426 / IFM 10032) TaxID=1108044 RepID=H5TMA3_GORO1|nr:NUDIX domain-containing protein [Gordonia otitidis]GAB34611.1 putative NTP pyrophosphohydrolase [Gordonia otitidis NBRC 100426]